MQLVLPCMQRQGGDQQEGVSLSETTTMHVCVPVPDLTICSPGPKNTELVMRDKQYSVVQPCTNKQDLIPSVNSSTIRSREDTPSAGVRRGRGGAGRAGKGGD